MNQLYGLDQVDALPPAWVGDGVRQLNRLRQQGYAVVPGVVVPAPWFQAFLETIAWSEPILANLPHSRLRVAVEDALQLATIAQQLQASLLDAPLPAAWQTELTRAISLLDADTVLLRPCPTLVSRGDLPSIGALLGVEVCPAEPVALAMALKRVWASLFAATSLFCWQRLGLELPQIHLSVLIQPVWPAIATGTVQLQKTQTVVEASWGLGLAHLWGMADPERYRLAPTLDSPQRLQAGYQEFAYQVQSSLDSPSIRLTWQGECLPQLARSGVQAYLLSESVRGQSVLTAAWAALEPLIAQLRAEASLVTELPTGWRGECQVEWHLYQRAAAAPQIYLTDLTALTPAVVAFSPPTPIATPAGPTSDPVPGPLPEPRPELTVVTNPLLALAATACQDMPPLLRGVGAAAGQVVAPAYVASELPADLTTLPTGHILVTTAVLPSWIAYLRRCEGVVAEQGGMTSHGAIVARELGIPAIVGAPTAMQQIQTGDWLWLDGQRGSVYRLPERYGVQLAALRTAALAQPPQKPLASRRSTPATLPQARTTTRLLVNLSQATTLRQLAGLPIAGVGLLRSELMMVEALEHRHPQLWVERGQQAMLVERLQQAIQPVVAAMYPHPVLYRSLDLRSHEFAALQGAPDQPAEGNPMLGIRGAAAYRFDPTLFDLELTALTAVQQAGYGNLHLLLPFVRTVEEFEFCRQRVQRSGLDTTVLRLWLMAEVPSVLLLLPDYVAAGVQGVSIGTNDLTQLLLGIDRDHPRLSTYLDDRHPAVLRAIEQLVRQCRELGIPCSICGQAPSRDLGLIDQLIEWGIDSISVEVEAVHATYQAIVEAEQRLLLKTAHYPSTLPEMPDSSEQPLL